jgi:hypothetical protein
LTEKADPWYTEIIPQQVLEISVIPMRTLEVKLTLPDNLAQEAEAIGLLKPGVLEGLLRQEIRRYHTDQLFAAADRLASINGAPLTESEVEAEIQAARRERPASHARGG